MENDVVYFVYLTKNKINGRMYIGQHRCKRKEVFTDGYLGSGIAIRLAIKNMDEKILSELFWNMPILLKN